MSSSRLAAIFLVASCNQVFGNHTVGTDPNAIYDAPIDSPFECPAIGKTPRFSPLLRQYQIQDCTYYTQVGSEAIGYCGQFVSIGPIGMPLVPANGIPVGGGEPLPRLAPDGSYMVISQFNGPMPTGTRYLRDEDTWTLVGPQPEIAALALSNIVHVAGADRIVARALFATTLDELVFDGSTWTKVGSHPDAEFAVDSGGPTTMYWTRDALRMVISDSLGNLFYTDRSTVDAAFRQADMLGVSGSQDMSMPDDCSRMYVTGLGSILYLQQL